MAPKEVSKKRVRIQPGHEERFIENHAPRRSNKKPKKKKKPLLKTLQSSRSIDITRRRTHRPTVSELVYHFLERASNRGVAKRQKGNATSQFRQVQRRKRGKSYKYFKDPTSLIYPMPYTSIPTPHGNRCIEKCIMEVLSFGTALGLLQPTDATGSMFRVVSDLKLFRPGRKRQTARDISFLTSHKKRTRKVTT